MSQKTFTGIVRLVVNMVPGGFTPHEAQIGLADIAGYEDRFLNPDGTANALGCKLMTVMFANALAANILTCEALGFMDKTEHLALITKILSSNSTPQTPTITILNPDDL